VNKTLKNIDKHIAAIPHFLFFSLNNDITANIIDTKGKNNDKQQAVIPHLLDSFFFSFIIL